MHQANKRERRGKLSRGLQHDNARPHVSSKTVAAIRELSFECWLPAFKAGSQRLLVV